MLMFQQLVRAFNVYILEFIFDESRRHFVLNFLELKTLIRA